MISDLFSIGSLSRSRSLPETLVSGREIFGVELALVVRNEAEAKGLFGVEENFGVWDGSAGSVVQHDAAEIGDLSVDAKKR